MPSSFPSLRPDTAFSLDKRDRPLQGLEAGYSPGVALHFAETQGQLDLMNWLAVTQSKCTKQHKTQGLR
jgi:hypothetical protein